MVPAVNETVRETASASEPPEGPRGRIASAEFFFLLERMDRMEENLRREISLLRQEVGAIEDKVRTVLNLAVGVLGIAVTILLAVLFRHP